MSDDSEPVAYEFEIRDLETQDNFHTTIQTTHPSETFGEMDRMEYRNVRELVYRD